MTNSADPPNFIYAYVGNPDTGIRRTRYAVNTVSYITVTSGTRDYPINNMLFSTLTVGTGYSVNAQFGQDADMDKTFLYPDDVYERADWSATTPRVLSRTPGTDIEDIYKEGNSDLYPLAKVPDLPFTKITGIIDPLTQMPTRLPASIIPFPDDEPLIDGPGAAINITSAASSAYLAPVLFVLSTNPNVYFDLDDDNKQAGAITYSHGLTITTDGNWSFEPAATADDVVQEIQISGSSPLRRIRESTAFASSTVTFTQGYGVLLRKIPLYFDQTKQGDIEYYHLRYTDNTVAYQWVYEDATTGSSVAGVNISTDMYAGFQQHDIAPAPEPEEPDTPAQSDITLVGGTGALLSVSPSLADGTMSVVSTLTGDNSNSLWFYINRSHSLTPEPTWIFTLGAAVPHDSTGRSVTPTAVYRTSDYGTALGTQVEGYEDYGFQGEIRLASERNPSSRIATLKVEIHFSVLPTPSRDTKGALWTFSYLWYRNRYGIGHSNFRGSGSYSNRGSPLDSLSQIVSFSIPGGVGNASPAALVGDFMGISMRPNGDTNLRFGAKTLGWKRVDQNTGNGFISSTRTYT